MHLLQSIFLSVLCIFYFSAAEHALHVIIKDCELYRAYSENVNSSSEFIFMFDTSKIAPKTPVRVFVQSEKADKTFPLLFVVRQQKGVLSWQLPYVVETADTLQQYLLVSRTLCPVSNYYKTPKRHQLSYGPYWQGVSPLGVGVSQDGVEPPPSLPGVELSLRSLNQLQGVNDSAGVIVSVSTASQENVTFRVSASVEDHFYIHLDEELKVNISPSEPRYYAFEFPPNVSTILLEASSEDGTCMTISVQNISCPVFDLEGNVQFEGMWQTMTKKGGITLLRERFPLGFFLVFVVRGDDAACLGDGAPPPSPGSRHKNVTFSLRRKISYDEYLVATFGAFGTFLAFFLVAFVVVVLHHMKKRTVEESLLPEVEEDEEEAAPPPCLQSPSSPQEARQLEFLWSKISRGDEVFVSDISRLGCPALRQSSQLYLWNLLTVAVFYSLPVVQLVITYQRVLNNTGNQDLCFYNFLCSHPVGVLSDFNHVYSNIGYGMLGLLFTLLVYRREKMHLAAVAQHPVLDHHFGLPQQFGLFYAMGAALISEGVLSACYHVCPNYTNFQFDTSFMYVIAMMCMLRIYQNRHPDIHASAYTTFGALAVVIFIGMTGVLTGTPVFWALFTAFHILACVVLSAQVYYMGCWSLDLRTLNRVIDAYRPSNNSGFLRCIAPMHPRRMVLLIIGNLVNIGLAVLGVMYHPRNFASYLLAIFMANLNIYCWFYIIMKCISGERIRPQPLVYILLSFVLWGLSLYFFFHKAISWEQTPALSRTYNHPCNILDFYDNHDIWHFLSAGSMFFSFLVLLTLDDDLMHVPRNQIRVF